MRADFQRYYGLNLDDIGKTYTYKHAAALTAYLPPTSAYRLSLDPDNQWDLQAHLLAHLADITNLLRWQLTRENSDHRPPPLIPRPGIGLDEVEKTSDVQAMDIDQLDELLARKRQ